MYLTLNVSIGTATGLDPILEYLPRVKDTAVAVMTTCVGHEKYMDARMIRITKRRKLRDNLYKSSNRAANSIGECR